jgi:hypothetical protein
LQAMKIRNRIGGQISLRVETLLKKTSSPHMLMGGGGS